MTSTSPTLPLEGLRVLDLSRLLPGPLCSLFLADMGADVVKIEDPRGGDYARWMPPLLNTMSGLFASLNRNKRSLALNLKDETDRAILLQMVEKADVLLDSFRPGVLDRLGLSYETLKARNPRLIVCAITGYGQDGPFADKAGHDLNYVGLAGVLQAGQGQGPPALPPVQMADVAGGSYLGLSHILAALYQRERTGEGCFCDVSMTEGVLPFLALWQGMCSAEPALHQSQGLLNGAIPAYRLYRCGDGGYLSVGTLETKFWKRFVEALDLGHLDTEGLEMGDSGEKVAAEVEARLAEKSRDEWVEWFADKDCCVEAVLSVKEALDSPLSKQRGWTMEAEHPTEGKQRYLRSPFRFSGAVSPEAVGAPQLDQHRDEILLEYGIDLDTL